MPESQTTTAVAKYQNILFDARGQVAIVTLNRPQRRNALSLIAPFCNGPVSQPCFCAVRSPGTRFCPGLARGRRLMVCWRIGRPIYERVVVLGHWTQCGLT